ncbi:MAG: hypothetical protein RR942_05815 [Romboutsia sp.]
MGKNKVKNNVNGQLTNSKVKRYEENFENKNTFTEQNNNNKNSFK